MRICSVLALVLVTGCVADDITAADETADGDQGGKADGAGTQTQLAPTYALELTSTMRTEDNRESEPAKRFADLSMRARAQVAVTQTGNIVQLAVKICDVRLPVVSGFQPELPAALFASLPPLAVSAHLDRGDLVTDPAAIVLGATLAHPLDDALPDAGSAAIRDQDGDGKPGVSISINVGSIYAALRVKLAFAAPVATLTGVADVTLDQKLYGDSIPFYDAVASAIEADGHITVVSSSNRVTMKRDASTCAAARQLFP